MRGNRVGAYGTDCPGRASTRYGAAATTVKYSGGEQWIDRQIGVVGVGRGGSALVNALLAEEAGRAADSLVGAVTVESDADDVAASDAIDRTDRRVDPDFAPW